MVTPVSVTSTANLDANAEGGPLWGTFNANPVYNKPFLDLSNPLILAAALGVAWWLWKRRK